MLGMEILDPYGVESGGRIRGMELLPVRTELKKTKTRMQTKGRLNTLGGIFHRLSGMEYAGYEIHMGETFRGENVEKGPVLSEGNVYGSYVHGLFDQGGTAAALIHALAEEKGILLEDGGLEDYQSFKEKQYDKLADTLREYLNMEEIYGLLKEAHLE